MITLEPMTCRECGTEIVPSPAEVLRRGTATSFTQCYYICKTPGCNVAYTNAQAAESRTKIFRDPLRNIPEQVQSGVLDALRSALNIRNRSSKLAKFAFETSEDALTWTFFRYSLEKELLSRLFDLPSLGTIRESAFWGYPWPTATTSAVIPALTTILDELKEDPQSYSEPDFIADDGAQLLFVEVKFRAPNDRQTGDVNFQRYLSDASTWFSVPESQVREAGYYELVRNWVIGNLLAKQLGRTFLLVNLAKPHCQASAAEFATSLREPERFRFLKWDSVISRLPTDTDQWFLKYLNDKGMACQKRTRAG